MLKRVEILGGPELEAAKVVLNRRMEQFETPPEKTIFGDSEANYQLSDEEWGALALAKAELGKQSHDEWDNKLAKLADLERKMEKAGAIVQRLQEAGENLKNDGFFIPVFNRE